MGFNPVFRCILPNSYLQPFQLHLIESALAFPAGEKIGKNFTEKAKVLLRLVDNITDNPEKSNRWGLCRLYGWLSGIVGAAGLRSPRVFLRRSAMGIHRCEEGKELRFGLSNAHKRSSGV